MERSSYPILILTKKDGGRLLKKLDQYGDVVHVLARVDAESEVHVQLARSPTASKRGAIGSTTERNGIFFILYSLSEHHLVSAMALCCLSSVVGRMLHLNCNYNAHSIIYSCTRRMQSIVGRG